VFFVGDEKTILVIDDVEENVDIIILQLSKLGYKVISAYDGEQGLQSARTNRPDLILSDIMLPKMDGWQILSELKKDPDLANIPVVLMTAYTTIQFRGERKRAMELGAADYLKKPFDLAEMAEIVKNLLGKP